MIWNQQDRGSLLVRPRRIAVVAMVCLVLVLLLAVLQVTHMHSFSADADHCPICIVLHAAAPVSMTIAAIILVQLGTAAPVCAVARLSRPWCSSLFIRPPPFRG